MDRCTHDRPRRHHSMLTALSPACGSGMLLVMFFVGMPAGLLMPGCSSSDAGRSKGMSAEDASTPTPAPLEFTSALVLDPAVERESYETILEARGGVEPYRFDVVSAYPPWGLRLDPETGILGGTPSWRGTFDFEVRVRDAEGRSRVETFTLSVSRWNPVASIGCGEAMELDLSASAYREGGGHQLQSLDEAAFFSLELPPEDTTQMIIRASGSDGGDPALFLGRTKEAPGSTRVAYYYRRSVTPGDEVIRVHDASSPSLADYRERGSAVAMALAATAPGHFTVEVECLNGPVLVDEFIPNAPLGASWSYSLSGLSSEGVLHYSAPEGLPEGLSLSDEGVLSGRVETPGLRSFILRLQDDSGRRDERGFELWTPEVTSLHCDGDALDIALETWAFNDRAGLSTHGGAAFFSLAFDDAISRILFSIQASDGGAGALFIGEPGTSPGESRQEWMARRIYDSGARDDSPTSWTIDAQSYPPLDRFAGLLPFALAAVDGPGTIHLEIDCVHALDVATSGIPAGRVGDSYSAALIARGGQPPYSWTSDSVLPKGLVLGEDGVLEGIAEESGHWILPLRVRDALGAEAEAELYLTIGDSGAPYGCGDALPLTCGDIVAVELEQTQWVHRLEFNSELDPIHYCLVIPDAVEGLEIEVESSEGDPDVFLTWPAIPPGDPDLRHYRRFAAFDGDDTLRIDGTRFPRPADFDGTAGIMLGAYAAGSSYVTIDCD